MLYHRGYVVFASIALVGLLALAGCGEGGEEKSSSAPPPAPALQQKTVAKPAVTEAVSVEEGKKLFQQTCSACHGMDAKGGGAETAFQTVFHFDGPLGIETR